MAQVTVYQYSISRMKWTQRLNKKSTRSYLSWSLFKEHLYLFSETKLRALGTSSFLRCFAFSSKRHRNSRPPIAVVSDLFSHKQKCTWVFGRVATCLEVNRDALFLPRRPWGTRVYPDTWQKLRFHTYLWDSPVTCRYPVPDYSYRCASLLGTREVDTKPGIISICQRFDKRSEKTCAVWALIYHSFLH